MSRSKRLHPTSLAVAVLLLPLVAACSSSGSSAAEPVPTPSSTTQARTLLDQVYSNARGQASVRAAGNGECPQGPFGVDMHLNRDESAQGWISFGGEKIQVRAIKPDLYLKASAKFWQANGSAAGAQLVGDKWVKSSNQQDNPCIRALVSFSAMIENFVHLPGAVTKVDPGTIYGQQALVLTLDNAVVFITKTQPALPMRVDSVLSQGVVGQQDGISFVEWGRPVTVTAPSADQTVSSQALTGT